MVLDVQGLRFEASDLEFLVEVLAFGGRVWASTLRAQGFESALGV